MEQCGHYFSVVPVMCLLSAVSPSRFLWGAAEISQAYRLCSHVGQASPQRRAGHGPCCRFFHTPDCSSCWQVVCGVFYRITLLSSDAISIFCYFNRGLWSGALMLKGLSCCYIALIHPMPDYRHCL